MRDIYILFDCPDATNDKKWLIEELCKTYQGRVCSVPIKRVLSVVSRNGLFGKVYAKWIPMWQSIRVLAKSKKGDVIICWQSYTGLICASMCRIIGKKRKLFLMNWLSPQPSDKKWKSIKKWILQNSDYRVGVNSPESQGMWERFLGVTAAENFVFIPDVYNGEILWKQPKHSREKYFFTGGMNNRDWALLADVARVYEGVRFVCVALETDFGEQVKNIPPNMEVRFNIPAKEYYSLMDNAQAVLLPLRDNRVAGLINIIRAAQAGVACCISKTAATEQYFPIQNKDMLIGPAIEDWIKCVERFTTMDDYIYAEKVKLNQNYIQSRFSGATAASKILEAIDQKKHEATDT